MKEEAFYNTFTKILAQPTPEREQQARALHAHCAQSYLKAVQSMTAKQAAQTSSDGRSRAQVVGHIMEWERFILLAVGELLSGVETPRFFKLEGYLETDGSERSFANLEAFNAHQAQKQANMDWKMLQSQALFTARTLLNIFSNPDLISVKILEQGPKHESQLPNAMTIELSPAWRLWLIIMEHEAVEHAQDLCT